MDILGNQPPHNIQRVDDRYLDEFLAQAFELARKYNISINSVIEARRVLEIERANNLRYLPSDHDERISSSEYLARMTDYLKSM